MYQFKCEFNLEKNYLAISMFFDKYKVLYAFNYAFTRAKACLDLMLRAATKKENTKTNSWSIGL